MKKHPPKKKDYAAMVRRAAEEALKIVEARGDVPSPLLRSALEAGKKKKQQPPPHLKFTC